MKVSSEEVKTSVIKLELTLKEAITLFYSIDATDHNTHMKYDEGRRKLAEEIEAELGKAIDDAERS